MAQLLRVENLSKSYPGVQAVNNISFSLEGGEVLALLGENGAGKSTLTKMICGVEIPDGGKIFVEGKEVSFASALDAMQLGINMVHQELSMVGGMSVAENIFMNRQPTAALGKIKWKELYRNTNELLEKFKLKIDPKTLVKRLPMGTQQLLEILKAVSGNSRILILDEPTSSLTDDQIELMFDLINMLKSEGHAIIYITHKLNEVFRIVDRLIVMRDGQYVNSARTNEVDANQIVTMMVGREIKNLFGAERTERTISQDYVFETKGLSAKGMYKDISFGVKKSEILGFAGLIGSGRTEMALGIVGAHKRESAQFFKDGKAIDIKDPSDAISKKIGYLTEDRKKLGLYLDYSLNLNLGCMKLVEYSKYGLIKKSKFTQNAREQVKKFRISTPSIEQAVGNLSGGNQQKCLLAAWIGTDPDVLIIDEPTRGVDVGAKSEIYQIIKDLAEQGKAIIVISSELTELLGICDRIIVMKNGRITGCVNKDQWSEEAIMQYATGINQGEN